MDEGYSGTIKCPYCKYKTELSRSADDNLYQHLRAKHNLTDEKIEEVLKDLYDYQESEAIKGFGCPKCGGRSLHLELKCTIAADIKELAVQDWWINEVFYSSLRCNDCGNKGKTSSFFHDFDKFPRSIKSGIFNME